MKNGRSVGEVIARTALNSWMLTNVFKLVRGWLFSRCAANCQRPQRLEITVMHGDLQLSQLTAVA
jgi:hypothetical protein